MMSSKLKLDIVEGKIIVKSNQILAIIEPEDTWFRITASTGMAIELKYEVQATLNKNVLDILKEVL